MTLEISIRILCNLKFWLLSIVLLDISGKKKKKTSDFLPKFY